MSSARIGFTAAALLLLASCQTPPESAGLGGGPGPGVDPGPGVELGSFSVSLTVGGAFRFDRVSYEISGNGFHRADTINVAASSTVSAIVGSIPFGTGYQLQLSAQDVDHKLTPCVGSATFSISSAGPVPVPVMLSCREVAVPPPAAVPVPRWASFAFAALLLGLGAFAARRRDRVA